MGGPDRAPGLPPPLQCSLFSCCAPRSWCRYLGVTVCAHPPCARAQRVLCPHRGCFVTFAPAHPGAVYLTVRTAPAPWCVASVLPLGTLWTSMCLFAPGARRPLRVAGLCLWHPQRLRAAAIPTTPIRTRHRALSGPCPVNARRGCWQPSCGLSVLMPLMPIRRAPRGCRRPPSAPGLPCALAGPLHRCFRIVSCLLGLCICAPGLGRCALSPLLSLPPHLLEPASMRAFPRSNQ